MRPFLLLATRENEQVADEEYAAFARFAGLGSCDLRRHRLEREPLGELDLDDWSGIILGGSPFTASDPDTTPVQRRAERDLASLLDRVVAADFPFLGACYGIGVVGLHRGAQVDGTYREPIGRVTVSLTDEGRQDPLFGVLPAEFEAFVGHKEAVTVLPPDVVLLARSATCPVQGFRVGRNVYTTQFHPELDADGLCTRIAAYRHSGYFDPAEEQSLLAMARSGAVPEPRRLLRAFVETYAR